MIEFQHLTATAGGFELKDINFRIQRGECHVIVGPTGAGKTFLIETMLGLRACASGKIIIDDTDITLFPPQNRKIAFVPQDNCLFPNMNARNNILFGLKMKAELHQESLDFVEHLIDFLKIRHLLERFPENLSGGEKQRVALARALATRPALLALDEPFSAIDHSLREEIRRLLKELLEEFKTTTLIITHDHDEAFFLGDRLSIMINGRLIQSGPREEMYYFPKSRDAAAFLGIKNIFSGIAKEVDQDGVLVEWPDLQRTLRIPCHCSMKRFRPGQSLHFGIRAESLFIIRPGFENKPGFHLFDAIITRFYRRGRNHTLIVEFSEKPEILAEIDIHDVAAKKLELAEGRKIKISIEPKWVFMYPD